MAIKVKAVERKLKFTKNENDPGVYRYVLGTSLPPAAKMVSICLAQSSIVIGMWRLAIRSANSRTPFTNCPISASSISFR